MATGVDPRVIVVFEADTPLPVPKANVLPPPNAVQTLGAEQYLGTAALPDVFQNTSPTVGVHVAGSTGPKKSVAERIEEQINIAKISFSFMLDLRKPPT